MRILLVDDDQINTKIFSKRLEKRGYEVDVVSSGPAALDYIENNNLPLLVLLDIVMPVMDGFDVLTNIRKKFTAMEVPIIMMTAKDKTEDIVKCLSLGANDYITKPANIDISVARIETQQNLALFQIASLRKREAETVNTMVATYHHEINNPLTIAMGCLNRDLEKLNDKHIQTAFKSMKRIAEIVEKIDIVTTQDRLEETEYMGKTKMLKLS